MDPQLAVTYDPSSQLPRPQLLSSLDTTQSSPSITYPCQADVMYIQQQFAAGAPPSLVVSVPLVPNPSHRSPERGSLEEAEREREVLQGLRGSD